MADEFPRAEVIGVDLAPIQPRSGTSMLLQCIIRTTYTRYYCPPPHYLAYTNILFYLSSLSFLI